LFYPILFSPISPLLLESYLPVTGIAFHIFFYSNHRRSNRRWRRGKKDEKKKKESVSVLQGTGAALFLRSERIRYVEQKTRKSDKTVQKGSKCKDQMLSHFYISDSYPSILVSLIQSQSRESLLYYTPTQSLFSLVMYQSAQRLYVHLQLHVPCIKGCTCTCYFTFYASKWCFSLTCALF